MLKVCGVVESMGGKDGVGGDRTEGMLENRVRISVVSRIVICGVVSCQKRKPPQSKRKMKKWKPKTF